MRLAILLLLFLQPLFAFAYPRFDSLWRNSNFVVYGQVVHHEISPVNLTTRYCYADIVIYSMCDGGTPVRNILRYPQPGDTIRDVRYISKDDSDTLRIDPSFYVLPVQFDSSRWRLTNDYSNAGVFRGIELLNLHCPIIYFAPDTAGGAPFRVETSAEKGWKIVRVFHSNGKLKRLDKSKWTRGNALLKRTEYDEQEHILNKSRTKTTHGRHHVTWTFRENGRRCLKRTSVWIID